MIAALALVAVVIEAHGSGHIINIGYSDGACSAIFDGRRLPSDQRGYPDFKGVRSDGGLVHIIGTTAVPYKCVGGVIYMLQAAGFRTIHFDAAPPDRGGAPAKAGVQSHR